MERWESLGNSMKMGRDRLDIVGTEWEYKLGNCWRVCRFNG